MSEKTQTTEESFDAKTFRLLVSAMREQQKLFFKTKTSQSLRDSKDLEKRVDLRLEKRK